MSWRWQHIISNMKGLELRTTITFGGADPTPTTPGGPLPRKEHITSSSPCLLDTDCSSDMDPKSNSGLRIGADSIDDHKLNRRRCCCLGDAMLRELDSASLDNEEFAI